MRLITPVIIPILLFLAVRLQFIDFIPRWDSSEYFQALIRSFSTFNFTVHSFNNSFNWFGHPSMAFGFLSYLLQSIDKTNLYLLHFNMILLSSIGIYSFYYICKYFFGESNRNENIILTSLFSIHPVFVSTSLYYSPDFSVLIFILATISTFLNKKYFLTIICGLILVFSKEIGVLMLASFIFPYIVLNKFREIKTYIPLLLPLFLYALYLLYDKSVTWSPDGNTLLNFNNNCRFCFDFKLFNIYQYFLVFFVLNFNWIFSIIILLGLFKISRNKSRLIFDKKVLIALTTSMLSIVVFFMFFIVYIYARYSSPYLGLFILLFGYFIKYVVTNKSLRMKLLTFMTLVMLVQTFNNFDFVSNKIFNSYKFGDHEMLKIGTEYLGDGLVYNTEFIYIQRLLSKFLVDYKIKSSDNIFIDPYAWGTFYSGWGNFKDKQPNIYWKLEDMNNLPNHMYYLSFPLVIYDQRETKKLENGYVPETIPNNKILEILGKKYDIKYLSQLNINRYRVNVYELKISAQTPN